MLLHLIWQKIRLIAKPNYKSYLSFYKILGFYPQNVDLYQEALLHKSFAKENGYEPLHNNERLEFLGDAVLDAIVAEVLYTKFPTKDEGFLTNTRSKIVQRETLNQIAIDLGLDKMLQTAVKTNACKNHIVGNALEAFIGAIYLDLGYDKAKQFVEKKILHNCINVDTLASKEVNFKSKLIEWCQKYKVSLSFELLESSVDTDNTPVFQTQVLLAGVSSGLGTGHSKKESHQAASKMAIKKLRADRSFTTQIKERAYHSLQERLYKKIDEESYQLNGLLPGETLLSG